MVMLMAKKFNAGELPYFSQHLSWRPRTFLQLRCFGMLPSLNYFLLLFFLFFTQAAIWSALLHYVHA